MSGCQWLSKGLLAILLYALVHADDDGDDAGLSSGARTNLKVGGTFFGRAPPVFGLTSTISLFGEHFGDGQYSLDTFLFFWFFYSRCHGRVQSFVNVGARALVPWSRRHFRGIVSHQKHYKTAIQSECTLNCVTRTTFPVFAFKVMNTVIL